MRRNAFNARVKDALTNARKVANSMGIKVTNAGLIDIALNSIKRTNAMINIVKRT
jgi:hypothetical protein